MKDRVQQRFADAQKQFASLNVQGQLDKAHKMAKDIFSQSNMQGHMDTVQNMAKKTFSQLNLQGHLGNVRNIMKDNLSKVNVQDLTQKAQKHFNNAKGFVSNVDYNSYLSQAQNL